MSLSRRTLLVGIGPSLAMGGCLRLQSNGGVTPSSTPSPTTASGLTAAFELSNEAPRVGEEITLDASPSVDPDGQIEEYQWAVLQQGGSTVRPIGTGEVMTYRFTSSGDFLIGLQVTDSEGNQERITRSVTVTGDASDLGDVITFEWGQLFVPSEDGGEHPEDDRSLAFACRAMAVVDGGDPVSKFDIGGETEPLFDTGVYGPESTDTYTFRWFGGPDSMTRIVFPDTDLDAATDLKLRGHLPPIDSQTLTMTVNGTTTAERTLTDDQYDVTLPLDS